MLSIKIDHKNLSLRLKKIQRELDTITSDPGFLKSTGQLLASRGKQNLEDGGSGNKSYALLAESTKKQKAKKGYSMKPLQRSGLMKRSVDYEVTGGLYMTGLDIIKHHQFGAPKANIPQREVFTVERDDMLDIQDFLVRQFKQKTAL